MSELSGRNRLAPRARSRLIQTVMAETGPEVTVADIDRELVSKGEQPVNPRTFRVNYLKVFRCEVEEKQVVRVESAATAEESLVPVQGVDSNQLSIFVKFAMAVEMVGGVVRARELLALIEQLGKAL